MNTLNKIILVLFLACAANLASAQNVTRSPLPDDVALSLQAAVQNELQLSDAQKEAIAQLHTTARAEHAELRQRRLDTKESLEIFNELAAKNMKALKDILLPKQFERLNQVSIQYYMAIDSTSTLANKLSGKLSLTEEQKTKLLDLGQQQRKEYNKKLGPTNISELDKKSRAVFEEQRIESLLLLTEEQKRKFDDLQGKKFDITTIDDYAKPK